MATKKNVKLILHILATAEWIVDFVRYSSDRYTLTCPIHEWELSVSLEQSEARGIHIQKARNFATMVYTIPYLFQRYAVEERNGVT